MLCYWAYWVANPASRYMPNSKYSAKIHQLSLTFTISDKNRIDAVTACITFCTSLFSMAILNHKIIDYFWKNCIHFMPIKYFYKNK